MHCKRYKIGHIQENKKAPPHKKFTKRACQLEEITGIFEQLTPLQFNFTEKPARFLKSDDCLYK